MTFTLVTKRKIISFLKSEDIFGELSEREFLSYVYDVDKIKSNDHRFSSFSRDFHQHRINNYDWKHDWWITDTRTGILFISDEKIKDLLCFIVSPECKGNEEVIKRYKATIEEIIRNDGYCLSGTESGHHTYKIHTIDNDPFFIPQHGFSFDSNTGYYDKIVYAKSLFWKVNATIHEKKSAIKELADILENMRSVKRFEDLSISKDADDIFNISNNYQIRHNNKNQKGDYDTEIFYDFIFVLYLNQIRLIERLSVG